jgi:nucleoside 2-deoxyribosyltransferase
MRVFECEKCHRFKQDVAKCTVYEIGYMKSKKVHYLCNDCKNAAIDKGHLVLKPI